jgi:hypothetical protein
MQGRASQGRIRWALLIGSLLGLAMLPLAAVASAQVPAPTVVITSPAAGSSVKGVVRISANATAASGQRIDSITFFDGANEIKQLYCENESTCSASVEWEATGLSGTHDLYAVADQSEGPNGTAEVAVNVVSPPPSVSITTPSSGATVAGTVTVAASGATDPSQNDYPTSITVYDGVNEIDTFDCQGQQTCQGSVTWKATGLTGTHSLTATIHTDNGLSVTSPAVEVTVVSPAPQVKITSPAAGARLGGTIVVRVSGATDPSQEDYPTSIDVYDGTNEIGSVGCQGQQTCGGSVSWNTKGLSGRHTLSAVIHTERGRSATSSHVVVGYVPQPHALGHAAAHCQLASLSIHIRKRDRGICALPRVPMGTPVEIQYRSGSHGWATAVRGHVASGGVYRFSLRGVKRATYVLAILVGANKTFTTTRVSIATLHII